MTVEETCSSGQAPWWEPSTASKPDIQRYPISIGYLMSGNTLEQSGVGSVDRGTDFSGKVFKPERLVEQLDTFVQASMVEDGIFQIARGK